MKKKTIKYRFEIDLPGATVRVPCDNLKAVQKAKLHWKGSKLGKNPRTIKITEEPFEIAETPKPSK